MCKISSSAVVSEWFSTYTSERSHAKSPLENVDMDRDVCCLRLRGLPFSVSSAQVDGFFAEAGFRVLDCLITRSEGMSGSTRPSQRGADGSTQHKVA